ncbi:MAG TPA: ATP-binding protein [Caulobacteraceae bacterium]|jgi:signal transduction histidine kinase/CheY-like chemotaxis protein
MKRRRAQVRMRTGLALLLAVVYSPYLGWLFSGLWFLSYGAMQLFEMRAFAPGGDLTPARRRLVLTVLAANSLLFGAMSAVGPFRDGPWSVACLGFLLGGAILNSVTATIGSRPAFIASLAPFVLYVLLMPFVALRVGASGAHAFMIAAAGVMILASAAMMWRIATASDRARAEAEVKLLTALAAAETANRAKSDFLANVSHEIRSPLNGVIGMAQAMAADPLEKTQRSRLDVIRRSGETLLTILNEVLDLSKIEAGKLELEAVEFDLGALVRGVGAAFDIASRDKALALQIDIDPDAEGVWLGDPTRVRQILYNLISNAIKFTQAGEVRVAAAQSADRLEITVSDTGIGMSPETVAGLFSKFFQGDASTTRRFGGTGLGLSICRELALLMGGDIDARSELGKGSSFVVRLELSWLRPSDVKPTGAAAPLRGLDPAEAGLRVLAAEDNATNRLVLSTLLGQAGIEVTLVEDGAACLKAWEADPWDIILMDVQMPVMDGLAATRAIRAQEAQTGRAPTPIVALTANALSHQVADYLAAGMDDHVSKPIEAAKLFAAIETQILNAAALNAATSNAGATSVTAQTAEPARRNKA